MKDVKEKNIKKNRANGPKKNNPKAVHKEVDVKENDNKIKDEGVVVKEIKVTTVNEVEEEEDKRLIVVIAIAILLIMATIMGLLVGCNKTKVDPQEIPVEPDDVNPIKEDDNKEEVNVAPKKVKKVAAKAKETKPAVEEKLNIYSVRFLFRNQNVKYMEVEEDSLVTPYVPSGYNSCSYFEDSSYENEYNFKQRINNDTIIYTVCEEDNYNIVYDSESDNITEYNVGLGNVALNDSTEERDLPFVAWYLDEDFSKIVKELTPSIINYADEEKNIHLYAKFEDLSIIYYDEDKEVLGEYFVEEHTVVDFRNVCLEGTLLGWNTDSALRIIEYKVGDTIEELTDNLYLYPVCGNATVVYQSEEDEVSIAYTTEELAEYNLPEPKDVGFETPTYYIPANEATENSKKVVPNEAIDLLENEVTLDDANSKAGSELTFEVGDNIEEHNKVFVGWTEDTEEPLDVLPDDFVPEDNTTTTLEAVYREQTEEELESGEYDKEEVLEEELPVEEETLEEEFPTV